MDNIVCLRKLFVQNFTENISFSFGFYFYKPGVDSLLLCPRWNRMDSLCKSRWFFNSALCYLYLLAYSFFFYGTLPILVCTLALRWVFFGRKIRFHRMLYIVLSHIYWWYHQQRAYHLALSYSHLLAADPFACRLRKNYYSRLSEESASERYRAS